MVSDLDELGELLKKHKITVGDIEYMINYLVTEDISPQLAMRRIKSFEQLREKIEKNADQEKVKQLQNQLEETRSELKRVQNDLTSLQNAKTGLEHEKQELESKSEILDSEREELQRQLQLLQEMQFEEEDEKSELQTKVEFFVKDLNEIANNKSEFFGILEPIISNLTTIIQTEKDHEFSKEEYSKILEQFVKSPDRLTETSKISEPLKTSKIVKEIRHESSKTKQVMKKDEEQEKRSEEKKKANQVINLFMEFINEAETDKSFQERVSTICDMDEAYEYLGSIGLSQVYSFASKGLGKKEELMKLFESWKSEGVPR